MLADSGSPEGLVFDASGNLWVADFQLDWSCGSPATLAQSGTPTPIPWFRWLGSRGRLRLCTARPHDRPAGKFRCPSTCRPAPTRSSRTACRVMRWLSSRPAGCGSRWRRPIPVLKLTGGSGLPWGPWSRDRVDPSRDLWTADLQPTKPCRVCGREPCCGANPDPSVTIAGDVSELDGVNTVDEIPPVPCLSGMMERSCKVGGTRSDENGTPTSFAAVNAGWSRGDHGDPLLHDDHHSCSGD